MSAAPSDGPFAVIGLGLIGGSIARDLSAQRRRVLGFDKDRQTLIAARRARVISNAADGDLEQLREARTVILAVPVDVAGELLTRIAPFVGNARLITDVGSTKTAIAAKAQALGLGKIFVGCHPLAGDHRSGWEASRRALFLRARVFVCPTGTSTPAAIDRANALWKSLGALPMRATTKAHDIEIAYISHIAHLLSATLALTLARAHYPRASLGAGGRDVTRLASSSPAMWGAIVAANGANISRALNAYMKEVQKVRRAVAKNDAGAIRELFVSTGAWAAGR